MPSTISAGTTAGTAIAIAGDTSGELQLRTNGTTTALTIGTNQNATFAGYVNAPNTFGFKNRIINGAMVIDQRNNGASVTASSAYTLDRWICYSSAASKYTVQQNAGSVTPPAGFINYLGATSTSAYSVNSTDFFSIEQPIEGFNAADLGWGTANAQTVTLSFWVRSSLTGTFGGAFYAGTGTLGYAFSYTISAANTWEQKSVVITGPTTGTWASNNTAFGSVCFSLGMGSSYSWSTGSWLSQVVRSATGATSVVGTNGATFYITGVQLEAGSTATSFDFRSYGTELALCQRYYYKTKADAAGKNFHFVRAQSTTVATGQTFFPVTLRTTPSALEQSGTAGDYRINDPAVNDYTCSAVPAFNSTTTTESGFVNYTVASGLTAKTMFFVQSVNSSAYLAWSAEL